MCVLIENSPLPSNQGFMVQEQSMNLCAIWVLLKNNLRSHSMTTRRLTHLSTDYKGKPMEKDMAKKTATGSIPVSNGPKNNRTCYKCGQLDHLSQECKQPKANIHHVGPDDSKKDNKPSDDNENKDEKESKTAKQSGVEKPLTASSNSPSPTLDPEPTAKEPPDKEDSLMDPDASPERYLPDEEEVNKDLLH
ncbi:hypothetical protein DSO57_1015625 [Entomophthora muscae]|uniref:Uncharacterized protein n=1 Tax=Entomophthora muscae TaxID=34485 RepID=A0ACC2T5B2_9FUNG|nr:hypothetical protein DSO57_1015625 [Entomophthora muscae]